MYEMWHHPFPWAFPWIMVFTGYVASMGAGFYFLYSCDKNESKLAKKALKGLLLGETI